jgi:hypothetical protein
MDRRIPQGPDQREKRCGSGLHVYGHVAACTSGGVSGSLSDSVEHHRLSSVDQDPPFDMATDGSGQHNFLQIAPFSNEIVHSIPVAHADHVLFDDRPLVQILCRVVRRRPDNFDSSLIRLPIGICADEGGKEGMVNVDHGTADHGKKLGAENLHVPGHHDEFDALLPQE